MSDVIEIIEPPIPNVVVAGEAVAVEVPAIEIVESAAQGPPGRDADAVTGALRVVNRLNEYVGDAPAQEEVQENIGLGLIDPLAYYILAKA